jgi:UDP-N-acetylmuramate--alanine ligase
VWQPHTYSRSRALLPEFRTAFEEADQVVVTEIYAARENPPSDGFSGQNLAVEIAENFQTEAKKVIFQPLLSDVVELLFGEVKSGDVVLVLSAGDADQISTGLIERLSNRILGKEN